MTGRLRNYGYLFPYIIIAGLLIVPCHNSHAGPLKPDTIARLDQEFQHFSRDYYQRIVRQSALPLNSYTNINELTNRVNEYIKKNQPVYAIALIHKHHNLLGNNLDAVEITQLTSLLLKYNDWHEARRILQRARDEAGKTAISNISFQFARYFMKRKKWQTTLEYLKDVINELSVENADYANLMTGTILQYEKKHRQAVKYYKKIKPDSKYYPSAVLNTAIAYIRQDWWTDAHIIINDLVTNNAGKVEDHMADRLNLVLGYALLRKEYFRNSRETFRNIGVNSPYTNKALLGIALSAANQDDYIGALNAITILKDKKSTDLSVDESYLLLPYTYGKLKQYLTASSAYTAAIKYYQTRISELEQTAANHSTLVDNISIAGNDQDILIGNNTFKFSRYYPVSFFDNYKALQAIRLTTDIPTDITAKYNALLSDYQAVLKNIGLHLLNERIDYLKSYLNQSRYGLARLYDTSLISANP